MKKTVRNYKTVCNALIRHKHDDIYISKYGFKLSGISWRYGTGERYITNYLNKPCKMEYDSIYNNWVLTF